MTRKLCSRSAQKLLNRLAAIDAKCKALYDQRDAAESTLIAGVQAAKDGRLPLAGGQAVTLRDNFVDPKTGEPRNVGFKRAVAVKRFEIQIV